MTPGYVKPPTVLVTTSTFPATSGPAAQCTTGVPVVVNGVTESWSIAHVTADAATVTGSGAAAVVTMTHNSRAYLVKGCGPNWAPAFYNSRLSLLDTQLNFTLDLSGTPCSCNTALYFTSAPAVGSTGAFTAGSDNAFYCDANAVGGTYCPEIDIIEANTAAWSSAPHNCVLPTNGYYRSCDKAGCYKKSITDDVATSYGPGSAFTIDTTKPFVVSTSFIADSAGTSLASMVVQLVQGDKIVKHTHVDNSGTCVGGYLKSLTAAATAGMVATFTSWGDTYRNMQWLDAGVCASTTSCTVATSKFSGFTFAPLSSVARRRALRGGE